MKKKGRDLKDIRSQTCGKLWEGVLSQKELNMGKPTCRQKEPFVFQGQKEETEVKWARKTEEFADVKAEKETDLWASVGHTKESGVFYHQDVKIFL